MSLEKRNVNLDLAKIIACCGVALIHTLFISETAYIFFNGMLIAFLYYSVPFFMMATGYTLFSKSEISSEYVAHKIASIIRLAALWTIVYEVYQTVLSIILNAEYNLLSILANLPNKFLHALAGEIRNDSFVVLWYLGALILVYVFAYIIKKHNLNRVIVWLSVLLIGIAMQITSYALGKSVQEYFTLTFRVWSWIQYALLGSFMPDIVRVVKSKLPLWLHGFLTIVALAAWLFFWRIVAEHVFHDLYPERFYDSIFLITFVALFFSFVLRLSLGNGLSRFIEYVCPLTVGVYLIHSPIILVLTRIIYVTSFSRLAIVYLIDLALSFLIIFLVSKLKISRYLLKI